MEILKDWVAVPTGELESLTCTLNEKFPFCEGVPEIVPADDSASPVGNAPDATDQL